MRTVSEELDYLGQLLETSSNNTLNIGQTLIDQFKAIGMPNEFTSLEQANEFRQSLIGAIAPMVNQLTEIIAASYLDDLGNQTIMRIKKQLGSNATQSSEIEDLMDQDDIDSILSQVVGTKGSSHVFS